ncbi:beta-glucosidase [Actinomyces bovis]|nr:glycoside hydrolase family 3 N-terminal domain-containing protein [Actinomyces bovis]
MLSQILTMRMGLSAAISAPTGLLPRQLSGNHYAAGAIVLVTVLAIIALRGSRNPRRRRMWSLTIGLAAALAVVAVVNLGALGPQPVRAAEPVTGQGEISATSIAASEATGQRVGDEGMVLAENRDHFLPLPATTKQINVFGWSSTNPVTGGTGSGASDTSGVTDVYRSLHDAGYTTNNQLESMYRDYQASRVLVTAGSGRTDSSLPEPPATNYTPELLAAAQSFSDTALVVISRSSGEGQDLPTDMKAVADGTWAAKAQQIAGGASQFIYYDTEYKNNGPYDDFESGEHYLRLSRTEKDMLGIVNSHFSKVVVLVNSNSTMELGWLDTYPSIKAVLLSPGTGAKGMGALGRILNGSANPSGRTADTFVNDLRATPAYNNFGGFQYNNVSDLTQAYTAADPNFAGVLGRVSYNEGIYVGYRYWETADAEGNIDYEQQVRYPFGYGLSYTSFKQQITGFSAADDDVSLTVRVKNTGQVSGKEVVQLYSTPPYTNGGIEKSAVNLVDFAKTKLLAPGESEDVAFTVPKEQLASYDSSRLKTTKGGYILEAGEYTISVRANSHTVLDSRNFEVADDVDYSQTGRASDRTPATNRFEADSNGGVTYLSRADHFANYQQATAGPTEADLTMSPQLRERIDTYSVAHYDPSAHLDSEATMPVTGAAATLKLGELRGLPYDDPKWEQLLNQLTVEEMSQLVAIGGFKTAAVPSVGKPETFDTDGPAGLRDPIQGRQGTAFPTEVLIAQTWNQELAREVGERIGQEFADAHIFGWYGPGMNTHRTAFGGRNFEYYSEDGVLSGRIASATVNGAAHHGVYAYIKHFALNDQETNRISLLQTYANEQTIREIYLRPFEIVVKGYEKGQPQAVMSSYNYIGTRYAGANPELLNGVLRGEWGFTGMVLSDWNGSYGYQQTTDSVLNGNDTMLTIVPQPRAAVERTDSPAVVSALRQASKNILYTVVNSGAYQVPEGAPE